MKKSPAKRSGPHALVLGVGNVLMGDEGLGVRAVESLKERYVLPRGVDIVDGGVSGAALAPLFMDYRNIIIVDALISDALPGTLISVKADKLPDNLTPCASAHQIGVRELIAIARFQGCASEITITGMVPRDVSPGLELTPFIAGKLASLVSMIKKELETMGLKLKERS